MDQINPIAVVWECGKCGDIKTSTIGDDKAALQIMGKTCEKCKQWIYKLSGHMDAEQHAAFLAVQKKKE